MKKDKGYKYRKLVKWAARIFVRIKFQYKPNPVLLGLDTPFIVVANHQTDYDAAFMMADIKDYFVPVASEHATSTHMLAPLVREFIAPIKVYKGSLKIGAVRNILRKIRDGHNVMIHPEGTRSYDGRNLSINSEIGKLVRTGKTALVTYRVQGGYFVTPRWAHHARRGKAWGEIVGVYKAEEVGRMTPEEVTEIIRRDLYQDAYETQKVKKLSYKGKGLAEGIENLVFLCPQCNGVGTLKGRGNEAVCDCGFSATIDEYGYFNGNESVADWNIRQQKQLDDMYDKDFVFEDDNVTVSTINEDRSRAIIASGKCTVDKDGISIAGKRFDFRQFDDLMELISAGSVAVFSINGIHYEISGKSLNTYKYWSLCERVKRIKDGR